ncbi:MAG TPA: DUF5305 family protein [Syntrophomonadaceae bacterium]|nr:DUF5305 family protein [Syntrophomonadaceae bacterium]
MKINLPKGIRIVLLFVFTVLFLLCGAIYFGQFLINQDAEMEEISLYKYQQTATVDYKVNLRPNDFFVNPTLDAEQAAYLIALTESMDTSLNYKFEAKEVLDYVGQYNIMGTLRVYARLDKDHEVVVWQRDYLYSPNIDFSGNDNMINLSDNVNIPIQEYAQNISSLEEATKFSASRADLEINYTINLEGHNGYGDIQESLNPTLIIPLKGNIFTVGGKAMDSRDGAITISQPVTNANKWGNDLAYLAIGLLALILLGAVKLFTISAPELSRKEKLLKELMRKYGARIVALQHLSANLGDAISLENFDDMVKVADELGKPIFYQKDRLKEHLFIIFAEPHNFQYSLEVGQEIPAPESNGKMLKA